VLSAKQQKRVDAKLKAAGEALRKTDVKGAEKLLREVLDQVPGHELATIQLVEILQKTERADEGIERLAAVVNGPLATQRLVLYYATTLQRARRGEDARKVLLRGAKAFPKNATMRVHLARSYGGEDRTEATRWYKEALAIAPKDRAALNNLAVMYIAEARYSDALPLLKAYTSNHPKAVAGQFNLASVHLALGQLKEAGAIYDRVLERRPGDVFGTSGRAIVMTLDGKSAEAQRMLRGPDATTVKDAQLVYSLGLALLFDGKAMEAEELLVTIAGKPGGQTWWIVARAEALRQLGRYAEADGLLTGQMEGRETSRPHMLPYLALVKRDLGKEQESKALLEEGLGLQSEYKRPEDLRYLVRMPPSAVGAIKTALAPAPVSVPAPAENAEGTGCGCEVASRGSVLSISFLLAVAFVCVRPR
jgi:predicted Zn-dependent protease